MRHLEVWLETDSWFGLQAQVNLLKAPQLLFNVPTATRFNNTIHFPYARPISRHDIAPI